MMLSLLIVEGRGSRHGMPDSGEARVKSSRSTGLFGALVALALSAGAALAQSSAPAIDPSSDTATIRAEMRDSIATTRAQEKSAAATRQQIQAIRSALRARFAALHH